MADLKKQAEDLGIKVDARWSDETLKAKIMAAKGGDPANHVPAQSEETANRAGEETEADKIAAKVNADGRTNPEDWTKNTGPGPGNPGARVEDVESLLASKPRDDDGKVMKTEETPKVIHETVATSGGDEITNNVLPDMAQRSPFVIAAESLGIRVDPTWDDARLKAEMQQAMDGRADLQVKGAVPTQTVSDQEIIAKAHVPIELEGDYWDEHGVRHTKGSTIDVSTADARRLIDAKAARRADKLPGE